MLGVKFDFWPLKVENYPNFFACRWRATYRWKYFNDGYNFVSKLTSIGGFHTKLWASKVIGVPILGISKLPLGSPGTKWDLGVGLWLGTKNTIRGKVVASRKFKLWWILWVCVCTWLVHAPKVFQLHTNQLVFWFMHVHVSDWLI